VISKAKIKVKRAQNSREFALISAMLQEMEQKKLAQWFEKDHRTMPWRSDPSPYRVWISEIMLQQTQVAAVIPYFQRFLERFPNVESLSSAPVEEVLKCWAGLGYYSRARNLHKAAQQISASGRFPGTLEDLLQLPGVGPYTAGAIASIAYEIPAPIVDGNVIRVFARQHKQKKITSTRKEVWAWAKEEVFNANKEGTSPRVFNQALMELGATVCTPRKPDCQNCPVAATCLGQDQSELYPLPVKKDWVEIQEECLLLFSGDRVLLSLAKKGEWREGLWDLPRLSEVAGLDGGSEKKVASVRLTVTRHKIMRAIYTRKSNHEVGTDWVTGNNLKFFSLKELPPHGAGLRKSLSKMGLNGEVAPA
jgi:A/G-specific adenine glycosylase